MPLGQKAGGQHRHGVGQESTGVLWSDLLASKDAGLREGSRAVRGPPRGGDVPHWLLG